MMDYNGEMTLEEIGFAFIPIWVRAMKMPFGMMHMERGEAIGGEMGKFMVMDVEEDNIEVGKYLRIKVQIDICKPSMCGVTLRPCLVWLLGALALAL